MSETIIDVDEARFETAVVERSHEQPVVVDFWASWCGPCRTLGPMLETAVEQRDGAVRLAKVDVDENQGLAQRYGVRGIPAVKAFRDGEIVAEFTGAVGQAQLDDFFEDLVPSEADEAVAGGRRLLGTGEDGAAAAFRRALDLDPGHRDAAVELARIVVDDDPEEALTLVKPHRPDPDAESVAARAELALSGAGDVDELQDRVEADPADMGARLLLGRTLAAEGAHEEAVEQLLAVVEAGGDDREEAREQLVNLFTALGGDHPLVRETRPRLARALY